MRKIALILLLMLFAVPGARAQSLPLAARLNAHAQFERYPAYKMDEQTGEWSAHGLIAQQLLTTVEQGDANGYMDGGVCVLYPGVRGNRELSLMEPVLYVCLLRSSAIKADALCIATGGVRYDFVGKAEETKIGERKCERFALPLDEEGLALLQGFANEGGEVRVYGDERIFRTSIAEAEKHKNSKLRVEAMSIAAVRDFLTLWPGDYELWDLNQAHWNVDRPKMEKVALTEGRYADTPPVLEAVTLCLDTTKGSAVKAYQQLLKDQAFFTAKLATNYGKMTRASTKQAQQYYGLLPTGMADRTLIELLTGTSQPGTDEVDARTQTASGASYMLDGQLSIRLDRVWEAKSIAPINATGDLDWLWPTDRSNRLCAIDGEAVNLFAQTIQLPALLQATVSSDAGASYPCTILCERDEGRSFGTALLPQAKSRLLILCELPRDTALSSYTLRIDTQGSMQPMQVRLGS